MAGLVSSLLRGLFVGGAMAACSGSTDGSAGSSPIPLDDIARVVSEAFCGDIAPCCQTAGFPYDRAQCEALIRSTYDQQLVPLARAGKLGYDPAAAGTCVSRAREALAKCAVPEVPECEAMFAGTVPHGGACSDSAECATAPKGDAYCDESDGAGTCVSTPRGKAGDACGATCTESGNTTSCSGSGGGEPTTGPVADCYTNDGLVCGSERKCQAQSPAGGTCTESAECSGRAYCEGGTCGPPHAEGGDCSYRDEECATGLYCREGTCAAELASGSPCEEFVDVCAGGTCANGECVAGESDLVSPELCGG